jgi:hypothetical protein
MTEGCSGKNRYGSAQECLDVLHRMKARWESGSLQDACFATRGYVCECGSWHLSKDPERRADTDVIVPIGRSKTAPKRSAGYYKRKKKLARQSA